MGEVSDEGLEDHLYWVLASLGDHIIEPKARDYINAIKNEGWVPATHVARSRALMEDAQRELVQERAKNAELERRIKELEYKETPLTNITITNPIKSVSADKIAATSMWDTALSWAQW